MYLYDALHLGSLIKTLGDFVNQGQPNISPVDEQGGMVYKMRHGFRPDFWLRLAGYLTKNQFLVSDFVLLSIK